MKMRRKGLLAALLAILLLISPGAGELFSGKAAAQGEISITVNGAPLNVSTPAFIENGSVLVPLREIAEALGAAVGYGTGENGAKSATLARGERSATLTIGSAIMIANGKSIKLSVAPRLLGDVTIVPLRALSESLGTVVAWDGANKVVTINEPEELPVIGTAAKLKEIMQAAVSNDDRYYMTGGAAMEDSKESSQSEGGAAAPEAETAGSGGDYSGTNVQVAGVDEADYAKTDGRFIYQISGSQVLVISIANPAKPRLAAQLDYASEKGFIPQELYADGARLIVIGGQSAYGNYMYDGGQIDAAEPSATEASSAAIETKDTVTPTLVDKKAIMPPIPTRNLVKTFVYEMNESGLPKQVRMIEQEGSYIDSRKVGSALYIVSNKFNHYYTVLEDGKPIDSETVRSFEPVYGDSSISDKQLSLPLSDIRYFPNSTDSSMLLIGSLDLEQPEQKLQLSAYLGAGQTVYASEKHLYVTTTKYVPSNNSGSEQTQLYKFRLDQGHIVYVGGGSVPGSLLNQFSMDEHNGYFRIAVTKGNVWARGADGATNNMYVLDENLKVIGKLEGLAPGERIYSVRFMGNRAYMVTFRNVDPLFAIDLRNPVKPTVLGQLKIPGYSDYLHPYDENHLIGFGKETVIVSSGDGTDPDSATAFYQGMKIAMFDVTNVNKPIEQFKEIIGDRGTDSELLRDHKALLFSKDKGLMAFPVQLHEIKNKENLKPGEFPAYGEFTYQGAYVYKVDLKQGFTLRGTITHLTEEDLLKSGQYGFDYRKAVKRILYAGDTLYTLSDSMVKANNLDSLKERGSLTYPHTSQQYPAYPGGPEVLPMPIVVE
ncbi:beta-propeller domain-containing protein [Paenibacillus harenae]|uniref:beta-propeller domain-containing protein n=1 Tax=Paenibacillus harenae TaxID=306543 RepID=UPI0027921D51|nr:beta-propeller domain-containing protein [Paenibacillus harenae]MDQ0063463.1 putative secreted protein with C-terminal beta-propeller domain [Paenibacillus harenae]